MRAEPHSGHLIWSSSGSMGFVFAWCSENTVRHTEHTNFVSVIMLHPALSSDAILHPTLPSCPSAVSTTEKSAVHLNPMSYDPAAAVLADGGEGVYGALEAVEYVRFTGRDNLESQIIVVPTHLASSHLSHLFPPVIPFFVPSGRTQQNRDSRGLSATTPLAGSRGSFSCPCSP
jgi:hypothetical protein